MKKILMLFVFALWCIYSFAQTAEITSNYPTVNLSNMTIHIGFEMHGFIGSGNCIAYFFNPDQSPMYYHSYAYRANNNQACASKKFNSNHENGYISDLQVFVPMDALSLQPGCNAYYYKIYIVTSNNSLLAASDMTAFIAESGVQNNAFSNGSYQNNSNNYNNSYNNNSPKSRISCTRCNGTGLKVDMTSSLVIYKCRHNSTYGNCQYITCDVCKDRHCYHLTKHITCYYCHGAGFVER